MFDFPAIPDMNERRTGSWFGMPLAERERALTVYHIQ